MSPKKAKKKKVQRGGMVAMIRPHHYQVQNPYANVQDGEGWLSDAWDGIKNAATSTYNFIKDKKLVSTGLSMIPDARAKAASAIAAQSGFGHRRARKNVLKF